ncbi:phage portal protein [Clostridium sp.]|uniref:phage portal protein n=1 Tax=Clostridium sp. TaxID=1506 RepID=UPI001A62DFE3|nr:phage portal protein [Clostridium sp.]MBK5234032.1 phage portal protein [Clostridium sp.]
MVALEDTNLIVYSAYANLPYSVISEDLENALKTDFMNELDKIQERYIIYHQGMKFTAEGANTDYVPAELRYKKAKKLINKEARFMFSVTPDILINNNVTDKTSKSSDYQEFINEVLDANSFSKKLLQSTRDCLIAGRVLALVNFDEDSGIELMFLNAKEFYYEMSGSETLERLIVFYIITDSTNTAEKRVKKKVYTMQNGYCHIKEIIYDGAGREIEILNEDLKTLLTVIPAKVIFNDGLSNDIVGESEIDDLKDYEAYYSKLANADMDAERKGMNAIRYTIDASTGSTQSLSSAPGAYWDLQSDDNGVEQKSASVGLVESTMGYSSPLKVTLDRVETAMHDQVSVPNISNEKLQGIITSGKTLKAIYWDLVVRCDEKMLTWKPAIKFLSKLIIDGSFLYPKTQKMYIPKPLTKMDYRIDVVNNYPLLEDETEEKGTDLSEVAANTMSKKAYMKKWRGLTEDEVSEELKQILLEKNMFEDSYLSSMGSPVSKSED